MATIKRYVDNYDLFSCSIKNVCTNRHVINKDSDDSVVDYFKQNEQRIIQNLVHISINLPSVFDEPDERFMFSKFYMQAFALLNNPLYERHWECISGKSYDLKFFPFLSNLESYLRFSMKSQKSRIFSGNNINTGRHRKGGRVIIKNHLGNISKKPIHIQRDSDYTILIQRQNKKDGVPFALGVMRSCDMNLKSVLNVEQIILKDIDKEDLLFFKSFSSFHPENSKQVKENLDIIYKNAIVNIIKNCSKYGMSNEHIKEFLKS